MYKVKVLGAGSIGNHLANASRRRGWQVAICDLDPAALARTRNEIYPSRYGAWDEAIELYPVGDAPKSVYDLIVIGTPPDTHVDLAIEAITEGPRAVLVEKPVCGPDLARAQEMFDLAKERGVQVFVGYDHVVGASAVHALEKARTLGRIETLDVEFREYWGGIFAAHPWLDGPQDSYLGFWKRGGGASGEHSHAINLWQHFAQELGGGRVVEVNATLEYVKTDLVDYDSLCLLNLRSKSGLVGRVVQDVVTQPPRKWARIQAERRLHGTLDRLRARHRPGRIEARRSRCRGTRRRRRRDQTTSSPNSSTSRPCSRGAATPRRCTSNAASTPCSWSRPHTVRPPRGAASRIDYSAGYTPAALTTH